MEGRLKELRHDIIGKNAAEVRIFPRDAFGGDGGAVGGLGLGGTDTLDLHDGVVIVGLYIGGTEQTIRFKLH